MEEPLRLLRSFIAELLEIRDKDAKSGKWWEIDFIIVLLFGSFIAGAFAWFSA